MFFSLGTFNFCRDEYFNFLIDGSHEGRVDIWLLAFLRKTEGKMLWSYCSVCRFPQLFIFIPVMRLITANVPTHKDSLVQIFQFHSEGKELGYKSIEIKVCNKLINSLIIH